MGELLNRGAQHAILEGLQNVYPQAVNVSGNDGPDHVYRVNIAYLEEHGLVAVKWHDGMRERVPVMAKITAKGLDFLQNDGGLGAILGVVTIKLHDDTIRKLLIQKVEASGAEDGVKTSLIAKIKELPAEALGSITQRALDAGLDRLPDLAGWLSKWLDL